MTHPSVMTRTRGETLRTSKAGEDNQSNQSVDAPGGRKGRRRGPVWVFGAVVFVSALLYWEQTALLYVLSTLAMSGLLIVVALSDLKGRGVELSESNLNKKAAAAGGDELPTTPSPYRRRATKRKHREAA